MSAGVDHTYKYRFATEEEAAKFAAENGFDLVVELQEPEYADKPFMCLKREWITDARPVAGTKKKIPKA